MQPRQLLGWIMPAVIVVTLAGYVGGVMTGRLPDPRAAPQSAGGVVLDPESADPEQRKAQTELCPLINRPEILELVDRPATVKSIGTSYRLEDDSHQCTVTLPNGSLRLDVSRKGLRISDYRRLFSADAKRRTVLGRPALWMVDPSPLVNLPIGVSSLLVAWNRADSGGMVELSISRVEMDPDDEKALLRIAEKQLPSLPGWPN